MQGICLPNLNCILKLKNLVKMLKQIFFIEGLSQNKKIKLFFDLKESISDIAYKNLRQDILDESLEVLIRTFIET